VRPDSTCQAQYIQHSGLRPNVKADERDDKIFFELIEDKIDATGGDVELTFDYGRSYSYAKYHFTRFGPELSFTLETEGIEILEVLSASQAEKDEERLKKLADSDFNPIFWSFDEDGKTIMCAHRGQRDGKHMLPEAKKAVLHRFEGHTPHKVVCVDSPERCPDQDLHSDYSDALIQDIEEKDPEAQIYNIMYTPQARPFRYVPKGTHAPKIVTLPAGAVTAFEGTLVHSGMSWNGPGSNRAQHCFVLPKGVYAQLNKKLFEETKQWKAPDQRESRSETIRGSVGRIIERIEKEQPVAVGNYFAGKAQTVADVTGAMNMTEAKAYVTAVLSTPSVCLASLRGTMGKADWGAAQQTELLSHIVAEMRHNAPQSRWVWLNIGEFPQASHDVYKKLTDVLPQTILGHLYWDSGSGPKPADDLKTERAIPALRINRKKTKYCQCILDPRVRPILEKCDKAWWDPTDKTFAIAQWRITELKAAAGPTDLDGGDEPEPEPQAEVLMLSPNGVRYEGQNGVRYEGQVKDGQPHGEGKYTFADGTIYEGHYKDGKLHGQGKWTHPDGVIYEGQFQDDRRHGQGKYIYPDGRCYEGQFQDGKLHGRGKYIYRDGDSYEGQFKDGQPNGRGKMTFPDGASYEGQFKDGRPTGTGTVTLPCGHTVQLKKWRKVVPGGNKKKKKRRASKDLTAIIQQLRQHQTVMAPEMKKRMVENVMFQTKSMLCQ
jgi:hypothetical protein